MAKIKVYNRNSYDYGVVFADGIRSQNIRAGSFLPMEEDDIYFLDSISSTFREKHLIIDEKDSRAKEIYQNLGFVNEDDKVLSKEDIEKLLKGAFATMKAELEKIEEPHLRYQVYEVAKTMDLPASKIKFVEEYSGQKLLEE